MQYFCLLTSRVKEEKEGVCNWCLLSQFIIPAKIVEVTAQSHEQNSVVGFGCRYCNISFPSPFNFQSGCKGYIHLVY